VDTCKTVKQSKDFKKPIGLDESGLWKKYSHYDTLNPHESYRQSVKNGLKNEINNIALDLAIKRETSYMSPKNEWNSSKMMSPLSIRD
tara:strand:+ start:329 stop:592 length:264 start_codon:yes stop_codon:yes gene_type:complete